MSCLPNEADLLVLPLHSRHWETIKSETNGVAVTTDHVRSPAKSTRTLVPISVNALGK